jgi:hypothetical protein
VKRKYHVAEAGSKGAARTVQAFCRSHGQALLPLVDLIQQAPPPAYGKDWKKLSRSNRNRQDVPSSLHVVWRQPVSSRARSRACARNQQCLPLA